MLSLETAGCLCGLTGGMVNYARPLPPKLKSRHGHIWRVFHLWLRFITFGGRLAHLAYHVHKRCSKTSFIFYFTGNRIFGHVPWSVSPHLPHWSHLHFTPWDNTDLRHLQLDTTWPAQMYNNMGLILGQLYPKFILRYYLYSDIIWVVLW